MERPEKTEADGTSTHPKAALPGSTMEQAAGSPGQSRLLHTSHPHDPPDSPSSHKVPAFCWVSSKKTKPSALPPPRVLLGAAARRRAGQTAPLAPQTSQPLALLTNRPSPEQGKQHTFFFSPGHFVLQILPHLQKVENTRLQVRLPTAACDTALPHLPSPPSGGWPGEKKVCISVSALFCFFLPLSC